MCHNMNRSAYKAQEMWEVSETECCQLTTQVENHVLSEKLKMLPKAQRRLIQAIQTEKDLIQPEINDFFQVSDWFADPEMDMQVYVPRLEVKVTPRRSFDKTKWIAKHPKVDCARSKPILLKESLKLDETSKMWMTNCIQPYQEEDDQPIPKDDNNPLLINLMEPLIDYTKHKLNKMQWKVDKVEDVFDETLEEFSMPVEEESIESPVPAVLFVSDMKVTLPAMAGSNYTAAYRVSEKLKKRWKFKKSVNWVIDASVRHGIFDELVSKFEVRFCVSVPQLSIERVKRVYLDRTPWQVSTYKTYMLNWKLFGNSDPRDVLNETYSYSFDIPLAKNDLCKHIKLEELNRYEFDNEVELSVTVQRSNLISPDEAGEVIVQPQQREEVNISKVESDVVCEVEEEVVVNSLVATSSTPESTVSKHKIDEMDTLIMKKKQRVHKAVMLDSHKYPYLDVFNQSSTFNLLPRTRNENDMAPLGSSEVVHVPMVQPDESCVLDFTEQSINETLFDGIPDGKRVWLFVNMKFGDRFGAGFLQLSELVAGEERVELLDFSCDSDGLEFDMFLNPQCGAIFLRPINIYQRDLRSGENMIFSQIGEIAHTVVSLVLVIVVEVGEEDVKVEQFVELAESYGIAVFVIDNSAKGIAEAMVELAIKYGEFSEGRFAWNTGHQFLEACGVQNPLLQEWILSECNVEEFVLLSEVCREQMLSTVCSEELVRAVNKAVRRFAESF